MPGQMRIRFQGFTGLDLTGARKIQMPRTRGLAFGEESAIRAGLSVAGATSRGALLMGLTGMVTPPLGSIVVSGVIPGVRIMLPHPDYTLTYGGGASVGAGVNYGAGGGIYFWNKSPGGEIGFFGSASIGVITNIAMSAGIQMGILFGPAPAVLAGDSITVGVDIDIGVGGISGMLIISAPPGGVWPPPTGLAALRGWVPTITGIAMGFSVGVSALPVDVTVMPGRTWTHAMASF